MIEPIRVDELSVATDYNWKFSFVMPECPRGFVPLGGVATGVNGKKLNENLRCVNENLTVAADASKGKNIL